MLLNILVIWGILFLSAGTIVLMTLYPFIKSRRQGNPQKTNIKSASVFILIAIAILLFSLCLVVPMLFL